MFGCLRRLGCLVVLLVVAGALYVVKGDEWLPRLRAMLGRAESEPPAAVEGSWEPLTTAGAARARSRVQSLSARGGPAYVNLAPADLASYVYDELRRQLPPSSDSVESTVVGDQLHVRSVVRLADLGGARVLGPLAQFLSERDTVQFGGTFEVVRPGLAEFRVRTIKLRQLSIPARLVPQILSQVSQGPRPEGVDADALPLAIPPYVSDVRIARGRVTVYKTVQ